jgi:hypothetical protein
MKWNMAKSVALVSCENKLHFWFAYILFFQASSIHGYKTRKEHYNFLSEEKIISIILTTGGGRPVRFLPKQRTCFLVQKCILFLSSLLSDSDCYNQYVNSKDDILISSGRGRRNWSSSRLR